MMSPGITAVLDAVGTATRKIEPEFFRLSEHGLADQNYRTRVYCYELFHQLRCCVPHNNWHVLSHDVHRLHLPLFNRLFKRNIPDFMLHVPTEVAPNLIVINVRPINSGSQVIEKEVATLKRFTTKSGGRQAISLIYGDGVHLDTFLSRFRNAALTDGQLLVMWHRHRGESAELVRL
jgi:hypothetical protein